MAKTYEAAWAKRDDPRQGRETMGCVWYRTVDHEYDIIRVGSLSTYDRPTAFQLRYAGTGQQIGVYGTWEEAIREVDRLQASDVS